MVRLRLGDTPDDRLDSWKEIAAYLKRGVCEWHAAEKQLVMPTYLERSILNSFASRAFRRIRTCQPDATAGLLPPRMIAACPPYTGYLYRAVFVHPQERVFWNLAFH